MILFCLGGLGTSERFYTGKIGVPKGIRTPVSSVKGRCPRPLDDGNLGENITQKIGGSRWIRTIDPFIKSEVLYQLS
jgi:hypothetical protein